MNWAKGRQGKKEAILPHLNSVLHDIFPHHTFGRFLSTLEFFYHQ
jgi:hypothetical protein